MTRLNGPQFVVMISIALLFASCSASESGGDTEFPPELVSRIESAKGLAAEILSDGHVTDAEYEQAAFAAVQCMESAGIEVTNFDFNATTGHLRLQYALGADPNNSPVPAIERECFEQHFNVVASVVAAETRLSGELKEYEEALIQCMRDKGFNVETMDDVADIQGQDPREIVDCDRQLGA